MEPTVYKIQPRKIIKARGMLMVATEKDYTWRDFAKFVGIGQGTLSGLLNGRSTGNAHSFNAILRAMNKAGVALTADELMGRE